MGPADIPSWNRVFKTLRFQSESLGGDFPNGIHNILGKLGHGLVAIRSQKIFYLGRRKKGFERVVFIRNATATSARI